MIRRGLLVGLVVTAVAGLAGLAGSAQAASITLGPDLARTGPATVAQSDPNDILWWSSAPGLRVGRKGEIRGIRIKGGTVQTPAQRAAARAFDPNYDITHWLVLRKRGRTWRVVSSSEDVRLPVVGIDGVTERTITELRQPRDDYRVCAKRGDRVALASVGGYVPGQFERGLPYQVFSRAPGARSVQRFRAGGAIGLDTTKVRARPVRGVQLQMQAILGTGNDARATCR